MDDALGTTELLRRWHAGDRAAHADLLGRYRPFIEAEVRRRLGAELRGKAETQDFVQDALVEALRYAPRFQVENERVLRRLLSRLVENILRDRRDWFTAKRREMARERPLQQDSVLALDPPAAGVAPPDEEAERNETAARVRLALELLAEPDRRVLVLREWDGLDFTAIGERMGLAADAARMRFHRALVRLERVVCGLRAGELERLLDQDGEPHHE